MSNPSDSERSQEPTLEQFKQIEKQIELIADPEYARKRRIAISQLVISWLSVCVTVWLDKVAPYGYVSTVGMVLSLFLVLASFVIWALVELKHLKKMARIYQAVIDLKDDQAAVRRAEK